MVARRSYILKSTINRLHIKCKLTICLTLTILFSCLMLTSVFAVDTNDETSRRELAKQAGERYIGVGGVDENVSVEGTNLSTLEVRDVVPTLFVHDIAEQSQSPKEIADITELFTAVVWSGDTPTSLLSIIKYPDGDYGVYSSTAGKVDIFVQRLEKMRSMTTSGEVCVIETYTSDYYFYSETDIGAAAIPIRPTEQEINTYSAEYGEDLLLPRADFEAACKGYDVAFRKSADAGYMGGGTSILENLPMNNPPIWLYVLAVAVIIGALCIGFFVYRSKHKAK